MEMTIWRIERIGCDDGPFQGTFLGCQRVYRSGHGTTHRPAPNRVPVLERAIDYRRARFGCYSLPNLRHWFPKTAIRYIEKEGPSEFHVVKLRARVIVRAGRQVVFDNDTAERLASFPLSAVHQPGALSEVTTNVSED